MSGTGQRYRLRVVGEGRHRVAGVLAFVVPQALDLLSTSRYVVSISEARDQAPGVMRIHRIHPSELVAVWEQNPNREKPTPTPTWCEDVIRLSRELGRTVTWATP